MSRDLNRAAKKASSGRRAMEDPSAWLDAAPGDSFVPQPLYVTRGRLWVLAALAVLVAVIVRFADGMAWIDVVFVAASAVVGVVGVLVMLQLGPQPEPVEAEAVASSTEAQAVASRELASLADAA